MEIAVPRIMISSMRGSSAKTLVSLGIIAALKKRGQQIAPFKKGPDFIDSEWLGAAAQADCHNLDVYLLGENKVVESFAQHAAGQDLALVEGNRGIFDGFDSLGSYSSAELAKRLAIPIILIVDCTKMTNTVSALIMGCQAFDPHMNLAGIILNRVTGSRHENILKESIERHCHVPVIGCLPNLTISPIIERHLGLSPVEECLDTATTLQYIGDIAEKYLDLDRILAIAQTAKPLDAPVLPKPAWSYAQRDRDVVVGIIRDAAFHFYYPENIGIFEQLGARLVFIDSMHDTCLPPVDLLYIGGGFPEVYIEPIASNVSFLKSLKQAAEAGLPIYAECGGAILLGRNFIAENGQSYDLAGVFPITFGIGKKPQGHGYSTVRVARENPFFEKDAVMRGHEFHYSKVIEWPKARPNLIYQVKRGYGCDGQWDGLSYKNVLASYIHIHAESLPAWSHGLMQRALLSQHRRKETSDDAASNISAPKKIAPGGSMVRRDHCDLS
jgi:cobyrinic acid a,c-diamide synthase